MILDQTSAWWSPPRDKKLASIEQSIIRHPLSGFLGALLLGLTPRHSPYNTIKATLSSSCHSQGSLFKISPISTLESFTKDLSLTECSKAGILSVRHLLDNSNLFLYESLQRHYCTTTTVTFTSTYAFAIFWVPSSQQSSWSHMKSYPCTTLLLQTKNGSHTSTGYY